jgi:hypothetical protein
MCKASEPALTITFRHPKEVKAMAEKDFTTEREELIDAVQKMNADEELCGHLTWEQKIVNTAAAEVGVIRGMTDKIEAMLDLIMENVPDPEAKPQESPKGKDELMEEMADLTDLAEQIHGLAEGFEYRLEKALKAKAQAPQEAPNPKAYYTLTLDQANEVDKALTAAHALAQGLIDGKTDEWRQGEAQTLAYLIQEHVNKVEEILEAGRPAAD